MFFLVRKGTKTFENLKEIYNDALIATNASTDFLNSLKAKKGYSEDLCWGGISGVVFDQKIPNDWVKCKNNDAYRPHATKKSVSEIRQKISSLPKVKFRRLSNAVNFGLPRMVGNRVFTHPTDFICKEDFCLFCVNDFFSNSYIKPNDVEEITFEMYKKLSNESE